ncbi:MAG: diguanylate cyclase [Lachnospiraceae bacterium]|nr:diguanylate cyclase [Lachnospiraceae bacterium]
MSQGRKQTILVVDDSEMNRSILADMLGDEYEIIEVEDGAEAVGAIQKYGPQLSLILLDIVMPRLDGFGVLEMMNEKHWIEEVPVIMISAESGSSHVERAYSLGVTDFISRPFDALIVHRRVVNTVLLYAKQKKLTDMVADQMYEKEQRSSLMIDILSHIVEFRNGESGLHVRNVHGLTELLLQRLVQKTDQYNLSGEDISLISTVSALHDIGKIAIDDKILNKPGRLTDEEFAIMKTHSLIGAELLENLPMYQDEPLVRMAYEICRWHHERYDGRGYPDGLKGEEIPISAQVVALADVYDALTSERVYKKAIPHEKAVAMILDGQCGAFNPLVLECLMDIADTIPEEIKKSGSNNVDKRKIRNLTEEMLQHKETSASERTLQLLEHERMKYRFFAAMSQEIQFEYMLSPSMLTLSAWGADKLGLAETITNPLFDRSVRKLLDLKDWRGLQKALKQSTPAKPEIRYDCKLKLEDEPRWFRIVARATWSSDEPPCFTGALGKAIDIHDSRVKLDTLERLASHDPLTGLLNHATAKQRIIDRLEERRDGKFALVIFDLDRFKSANDEFGHSFGDQVLIHVSEKLKQSIRSGDIAARVGGDEFLIFLEYKGELEAVIRRIFTGFAGSYENFPISLSMGVAEAEVIGTDYDALFHAADQALYSVKRSGRGRYCFYNDSMNQMFSVISRIDGSTDEVAEETIEQGGRKE